MSRTLLLPVALLLACDPKPAPEAAAPPTDPAAAALAAVEASVQEAMDPTVDPCQDFYTYACGGWLATTELPPDRPTEVRSFSSIADRNAEILRELLEGAAEADDPLIRRAGDFYATCMDTEAIDALGIEPLHPLLQAIEDIEDTDALMRTTGALSLVRVNPLFRLGVSPDMKDPTVQILNASQGGLGLPDRDFYLDPAREPLKQAYQAWLVQLFEHLGEEGEQAASSAEAVLAVEQRLAEASLPRVELRRPEQTYHRLDRPGLQELTPSLSWNAYFEGAESPDLQPINVRTPAFFEAVEALVADSSLDELRPYLRAHLVMGTIDGLPTELREAHFDFFGRTLSGQAEMRPRWRQCVGFTDGALGDVVGRLYVEQEFAGDSREIAREMIERVQTSLRESFADLPWMDEVTHERANEKLDAIVNKVGYPDRWKGYEGLEVAAGDHFGNLMAGRLWTSRYWLSKVGQPVDRTEWFMSAPTVNAYYSPTGNEIVFPAGILQPPFFDRTFPQAMNYGAIGMVMGHEVTHGFDDSGRKFDPQGALSDWWEPEAVERFEEAAQCVRDLYDTYEVLPGVFLNGELTAGENIADLGGIKHAYGAYRSWVADNGEEPELAGHDADQLFFLGYAQAWCSIRTPEFEEMMVTVGPHSSPRYRVIGPLSQLPAFGEAFDCEVGTPMRPAEVCEVW